MTEPAAAPLPPAKASKTVGPSAALALGLTAIVLVSGLAGRHGAGGGVAGAGHAIVVAGAFFLFATFGLRLIAAWRTPKASPVAQGLGELQPVMTELEAIRIDYTARIDRRMKTRLPLGLAGAVVFWAWTQFGSDPGGVFDLATFSLVGLGVGYAWASAALSEQYRQLYKARVLPRLAAEFGAFDYRTAAGVDTDLLRRHRLFREFDRVDAEDEVFGTLRGAPVTITEVALVDTRPKNDVTVFDGLLAGVLLPRGLRGVTAVVADGGVIGNFADGLRQSGAERVRLESSDFERAYQVYGTDQVSARALLTPAFMDRFMQLGARADYGFPIAIAQDNHLTIALPKEGYQALFEPPPYNQPAASADAIARLRGDIAAVVAVAQAFLDLDHSTRT